MESLNWSEGGIDTGVRFGVLIGTLIMTDSLWTWPILRPEGINR
jgi:hypothetical protein